MLKIVFQHQRKFTRNLLVKFIRICFTIYYEVRHDRIKREQNQVFELIVFPCVIFLNLRFDSQISILKCHGPMIKKLKNNLVKVSPELSFY